MIADSHSWKLELADSAAKLKRFGTRKRFDDRTRVRVELETLKGLYSVWKLAESGVLSDALLHEPITLRAFPHRKPRSVETLRSTIEERYDLGAGREVVHDLVFVCHQMVHNHTFGLDLLRNKKQGTAPALSGIYLTSAHQRRVALYRIELSKLITLLSAVADDHPGD